MPSTWTPLAGDATRHPRREWAATALLACRASCLANADRSRLVVNGSQLRCGPRRSGSGRRYKPATIRSYERALRLHVLPTLGSRRLSDIRRADLVALIDGMIAEGYGGSTIRNTLDPLRRTFVRAVQRDVIAVDPAYRLEPPATPKPDDRVASRRRRAA